MAQITPKLNLNKTPSLVESNSLIFAKNIRLDVDGTIHRDYGIFPMSVTKGKYINNLVNYKDIIRRIIHDIEYEINNSQNTGDYYNIILDKLRYISGETIASDNKIIAENGKAKVVGVIPDSNEYYLFIYGSYEHPLENGKKASMYVSCIIKYDEQTEIFYPCNCNWKYSGGNITGCVINNLVGDKILNIGEYNTNKLIPLKSINLNVSTINEDEGIYTQIPNIPITNLDYADDFPCVIPNGVYQFFVRYRIRKDFYTNWIPASRDIFVGNQNSVITSYGTLKYVNTNRDSDNSFILSVEHLITDNIKSYDSFQIGFILSHDDAIYARAWKHFNFKVEKINFDYKPEDAEEIEVIDLIKTTYGLYNVGNITSFKNKLYISNYTETNFNENLQNYANAVTAEIVTQKGDDAYNGNPILLTTINNKDAIYGVEINSIDKEFSGDDGIIWYLLNSSIGTNFSPIEALEEAFNNSDSGVYKLGTVDYQGFRLIANFDTISYVQGLVKEKYKDINNEVLRQTNIINFNENKINKATINGNIVDMKDSDFFYNITDIIYNIPRYLNRNCSFINSNGEIDETITIKIYRTAKITQTTTYKQGGGFKPSNPDDNFQINPVTYDLNTNSSKSTSITIPDNTNSGVGNNEPIITKIDYTYEQTITFTFKAFSSLLDNSSGVTLTKHTTLVPYQKYKFYIHFVKDNGEITNGYYCENIGELEAPYMNRASAVLYPIFKGIVIPTGYKACFFSICHTKINSAAIFDIRNNPNSDVKEGTCLDINMMLVPGSKNIHIKQLDKNFNIPIEINNGLYYDSSDASTSRYFGANGVITADNKDDILLEYNHAYAVDDYSISETENIELIKCTPYINESNLVFDEQRGIYTFGDYNRMNLLGYICEIYSLLRDKCIQYYNDGSSVFYKTYSNNNLNSGNYLNFKELSKYDDGDNDKKIAYFSLEVSKSEFIYSNFNLNYVALSEEPKLAIKTYYNRPANSNGSASEAEENNSNTIVLRLIPSQLMSTVYTLPSMYKSYTRKTFSIYNPDNIISFNNTIRSSILYGDENKINVLTFDANDYYNIPTNRGIITNLISVGDAILVHTKDSMFKFSGSNTLQSSDGEIQTPESKPFDTGVSEVFGSDFGFAGLQNKSDHIVTELGYIFFDRDSRIIYLYSGQGQIVKISDSIEKLFRHRKINNISFANDYYNNRFFISIVFYEDYEVEENGETITKQRYYPVTLSFNVSDNIKSFVSLHDFYFHNAFNTKTKCYFLTSDAKDICSISKDNKCFYPKLEFTIDKIYPQLKSYKGFSINNDDTPSSMELLYSLRQYDSIIDVIVNDSYETIKTLNAVTWCGTRIEKEFENIDNENEETLRVAEDINYNIPCKALRIYTDTCMTPLCSCIKKANDNSIKSFDNYKYPFYNQGIWQFNYFRNILNSKGFKSNYSGDNNSLIEGKYFVVRFVFNSDFKLETLTLNYTYK